MKRILLIVLTISLCGCSKPHGEICRNTKLDYRYSNQVSDVPLDSKVSGETYDKGVQHPTFYESLFKKLGIK